MKRIIKSQRVRFHVRCEKFLKKLFSKKHEIKILIEILRLRRKGISQVSLQKIQHLKRNVGELSRMQNRTSVNCGL